MKYTNNLELWSLAILAALIVVAMPELAWAQSASAVNNGLSATAARAESQAKGLQGILTAACYVGGVAMCAGGALSLKKHAESPANESIGKGLGRFGAGGGLLALPGLGDMAQKTLFTGSENLEAKSLKGL